MIDGHPDLTSGDRGPDPDERIVRHPEATEVEPNHAVPIRQRRVERRDRWDGPLCFEVVETQVLDDHQGRARADLPVGDADAVLGRGESDVVRRHVHEPRLPPPLAFRSVAHHRQTRRPTSARSCS